MTLSDALMLGVLGAVAYVAARNLWRRLAPAPGAPAGARRRRRSFARRSLGANERANGANDANEHSPRPDAPAPVANVLAPAPPAAPPAPPPAPPAPAPGDSYTVTPTELAQLAEAIHARANGASIESAVCSAFGVSKGAGAGYKRARALFDAATVLPGAAPAGTYSPPAKRRRAGRRRA